MKTVTFEVRSLDEGMKEFVQTWRSGKAQRSARIGFATPESSSEGPVGQTMGASESLVRRRAGFHT